VHITAASTNLPSDLCCPCFRLQLCSW